MCKPINKNARMIEVFVLLIEERDWNEGAVPDENRNVPVWGPSGFENEN